MSLAPKQGVKIRTLQVSVSLSRSAGGIFEIELALAKELLEQGVGVRVLGLQDIHWEADHARWSPVSARVFPTIGPRAFGYAPSLFQEMVGSEASLAHLHYMWMYPSVAITQWATRCGKPYVVTPNGMLEPWALNNSAWKKKLAGFLYENRMLRGATCLQANTEKELRDIRAYGLKNPVCVIPNGIDIPEDRGQGAVDRDQEVEKRVLLFLGRLHPKKGLPNALRAWAKMRGQGSVIRDQDEWQFVIAGWDQGGHEAELKRHCDVLGLAYAAVPAAEWVGRGGVGQEQVAPLGTSGPTRQSSPTVIFTGPAFGETKDALLRRAAAFILPSFSEGLPMSVLEAWAYRLPVLMTDHCNIPEGFAADAAWRIGTDVEDIAEGMRLFLQSPISDLQSLGRNGRALVEHQFTWPMVAAQMKEVYEWVLGSGERPSSIVL